MKDFTEYLYRLEENRKWKMLRGKLYKFMDLIVYKKNGSTAKILVATKKMEKGKVTEYMPYLYFLAEKIDQLFEHLSYLRDYISGVEKEWDDMMDTRYKFKEKREYKVDGKQPDLNWFVEVEVQFSVPIEEKDILLENTEKKIISTPPRWNYNKKTNFGGIWRIR